MMLAPIGEHWMRLLENSPELNLYNPDATHPSRQGTLLGALILHKMLVSKTLDDIAYYPEYLTPQNRKALWDEASSTLSSPPH